MLSADEVERQTKHQSMALSLLESLGVSVRVDSFLQDLLGWWDVGGVEVWRCVAWFCWSAQQIWRLNHIQYKQHPTTQCRTTTTGCSRSCSCSSQLTILCDIFAHILGVLHRQILRNRKMLLSHVIHTPCFLAVSPKAEELWSEIRPWWHDFTGPKGYYSSTFLPWLQVFMETKEQHLLPKVWWNPMVADHSSGFRNRPRTFDSGG